MMVVEFTNGHYLYPEVGKAGEGLKDPEAIRQVMAVAPTGALLVVLVGWALGSFAGGYTAAKISSSAPMRHALIVGVLLTVAGVANDLMLPSPAWFWVGLLLFIPAAWTGARTALSSSTPAK